MPRGDVVRCGFCRDSYTWGNPTVRELLAQAASFFFFLFFFFLLVLRNSPKPQGGGMSMSLTH